MLMRIVARVLAIVGMIGLGVGCFLFGASGGLLCLDYCPTDIPAALAHVLLALPNAFAWFFDFGMLAATLAWAMTLVDLARQRGWRWFTIQALSLPVALGLVVAIFFVALGTGLVPHTEDELVRWLHAFYFVLLIEIAWNALTLRAISAAQHTYGRRQNGTLSMVHATPTVET
jgi:hypothetical protein